MDITLHYTQRPGSAPRGYALARGYRLLVETDEERRDVPILTAAAGVRGTSIPATLDPGPDRAVVTWNQDDRLVLFTLA